MLFRLPVIAPTPQWFQNYSKTGSVVCMPFDGAIHVIPTLRLRSTPRTFPECENRFSPARDRPDAPMFLELFEDRECGVHAF